MPDIHPSALVDPGAEIGDSVVIGPFCVVEPMTRLAAGCVLQAHAQVCSHTSLGPGCLVGRGAILGESPQDLQFEPSVRSFLEVGPRNTFREHVTIHRGNREGGATRIGEGNYFMAGSHVGHDCIIGDANIIANACLLAGFVTLGNGAFLGGGSVFHQFIRIGDFAMAQGNARVSQDVPPYTIVAGLNQLRGLNVVGLRRAGFSPQIRQEIRRAFNLLHRGGKHLGLALEETAATDWGAEATSFIDFHRHPSRQGICRSHRSFSKSEDP